MSKQFIVDRHTTPGTPALDPVATAKVPVYDTMADAEADLNNLAEGQIIATTDTGDELAQPVDVVESGNLHAVSSDAVAESLSYSTTEQKTGGYWIDGKPIYRKAFSCGNLLDNDMLVINTGITDVDKWVKIEGLAYTTSVLVPLPYVAGTNFMITLLVQNNQINIRTSSDRTSYKAYVVLEYTKTTD